MQDGPRASVWSNVISSADGSGGNGGCGVSKVNWSSWPESRHSIRMSIVKSLACSDLVDSVIRVFMFGRCRGGWEDKKFWDLNREIRIPKSANKIRKIAVILFSDFCQFFHVQERCISA